MLSSDTMTEDISIKTETSELSDLGEPVDPCKLLDEISYDIPLKYDSDQLTAEYGSTHLITADSNCSTLPRTNAEVKPWFDDESKDIPNCGDAKNLPSPKIYTNHSWDPMCIEVGARPTPQICTVPLPSRPATKRKFHECSGDCTKCTGLPHQVYPIVPHDESDPLKPDPDESSAEYWSSGLIKTDLIRSNALPNCDEVKTEESNDGSSMLSMDTNHSCDPEYDDVAQDSNKILAGEDTVPKQPTISGNTDTRSNPQMIGKSSPSTSGAKPPVPPMSGKSAKRPAKIFPGGRPYACDVCDFRSSRPSHLKRHMTTHTGGEPYACAVCDFRASWAYYLKRHMVTHTGDKPYNCDVCGYRSSRADSLKRHMVIHGDKLHACHVCDLRFSWPSDLKLHMATHTGDKPYACHACDFRSSRLPDLKRHMTTHTGDKPYACDICDFRTSLAYRLNRHMATHTGEKPYVCNLCSYKAARPSHLKRHMKIHTGEKPYACNMCSYRSTCSSNVKAHMITHTDEEAIEDSSCLPQCSETGMMPSNTTPEGTSKADQLMSGLSHHVHPIVPPDEAGPYELSADVSLNVPIKPEPDEPLAEYGSGDFMTTDSNGSEPLLNHDEVKSEWVTEVDLGLRDPLEINRSQPPCEPSLPLHLTVPPGEGDQHELSADISLNVTLKSDPDQPSVDFTLSDTIKMEQYD